ncbi:MAG: hypothetical protein OXR68_03025, partial [Alphaproteobacteria bacterium]|nr:hypothetical protein [Alphaproteobacteria bacterium]
YKFAHLGSPSPKRGSLTPINVTKWVFERSFISEKPKNISFYFYTPKKHNISSTEKPSLTAATAREGNNHSYLDLNQYHTHYGHD